MVGDGENSQNAKPQKELEDRNISAMVVNSNAYIIHGISVILNFMHLMIVKIFGKFEVSENHHPYKVL